MTDSKKLHILETQLKALTDVVGTLNCLANEEVNQRFKMCMTMMKIVTHLKNGHAALARLFADSEMFRYNENARQEFLKSVANLETQCEQLENIIKNSNLPPD
jgi:protein subunit release factor A